MARTSELGVTTAGGKPIRWRSLRRWITDHGFPMLPGGRYKLWQQAPVTSEFAVTSWILSREQERQADAHSHASPRSPG